MDWIGWLQGEVDKAGGRWRGRTAVAKKVGYTERYIQDLIAGRREFGPKNKQRFAQAYPEIVGPYLKEMGFL